MSGHTHVVTYDGGVQTAEISARKDISAFANPLRRLNGDDQWALGLAPIPPGATYGEMLQSGQLSTEYIQAAGTAEAMTVEIRKPGGREWGAAWVRYTIGHPHTGTETFDVPIRLAHGVKMISRSQVFDADEAAQLFMSYYTTGDIPDGYELVPVEAYRADGTIVTLNAP